jgi:hypothetical protein
MTGPGVEPQAPPLGRYEPDDEGALHEVRLLNVPLRVLAAGREHHDEVMREFAMLALDENLSRDHVPARMLELIDVLGRRYAAASSRPDAEVDAALERGATTIDLVYHVPAHVTDAAERLHALMTEADEFCRRQQLLALARPRVLADFGAWYLDEFRRQINGEPPRPWDGPLDV